MDQNFNTENTNNNSDKKKTKKSKIIFYIILGIIVFILLSRLYSCVVPAAGGILDKIKNNKNTEVTVPEPLKIAEDNAFDGNRGYEKEVSSETIAIPGFDNLSLTEKYPKVKLINPQENTVYLIYNIYNGDDVVFQTDAIKPGNMVEADLYSKLNAGTYTLTFNISTYDYETQVPCNGTTQAVKVTIQK